MQHDGFVPPRIKLELVNSGNYGTDVVVGLEDKQAEREHREVRVAESTVKICR